MANDKFKELMEQIEKAKADHKELAPQTASQPQYKVGGLKTIMEQAMGEILKDIEPQKSAAMKVASNPKKYSNSMLNENIAAISLMTPAKSDNEWLVQVYPDDAGMLHFQAKTSGYNPHGAYTKWYQKFDSEVYKAVQEVYNLHMKDDPHYSRNSFYYGSKKKYLICQKQGMNADIPGYGVLYVPALFGVNPEPTIEPSEEMPF